MVFNVDETVRAEGNAFERRKGRNKRIKDGRYTLTFPLCPIKHFWHIDLTRHVIRVF